jgi:hypothetical protein
MTFDKHYVELDNLLSQDICNIAAQYALFEMLNNPRKEISKCVDIPLNMHSVYCDAMTESLLLYAKPKIEETINTKLVPIRSSYFIYKPGDEYWGTQCLEQGILRCCITLGHRYTGDHQAPPAPYPVFVVDNGENGLQQYISCEPGCGVIYSGDNIHGRSLFDYEEGSFYIELVLEYMEESNPGANKYKYDKRPCIGYKKKAT